MLVAILFVNGIVSMMLRKFIKKRNECEELMIPLLFILMVIWLSILVSRHMSPEITWFTYYIGVVIGLFVSGMALDIWNKRNRRDVNVAEIRREI